MNLKDLLTETFLSLTANKARSFLTILGIVVGITSVIVMVAFGQGTKASIESSVSSMGANLLTISPGSASSSRIGGGFGQGASTNSITLKDVDAVRTQVKNVKAVAPITSTSLQVSAEASNTNVDITGTTSDFPTIRNYTVQYGVWFTDSQEGNSARVAVLGPDTASTLFGDAASAIGQRIRISGQPFTVIGVTTSKGSSGRDNQDAAVYVPFETFQAHLSKSTGVSSVYVEAASQDSMTQVEADITTLLLARHGIADSSNADFQIANQADIASTLSTITNTLTLLLGSIAGISLVVGGIGIMNMMLTTVTERIREIGLRKALGATRSDLTSQFLSEAIALTMLGGLIGIALGWAISWGITTFSSYSTTVSLYSVVLAVGVSTGIGIVFGYYPARRAAKLDPIEALRYQ
ncbi:MAG: ABC transporter permease [Coriobacteriia bacterium]|nr:ABC transporter permease [Coriobacteriia bacterium]